MSSYLSEPQSICSALNETCSIVHGRKLVLWTDSKSAFKRIKRLNANPKCLYDVRVARLLSQFWANFTEDCLEVKFILAMYNKVVDILFG